MPPRDAEGNLYPRENESQDESNESAGTSYDEIKKAHEDRVRAMEEQFEKQQLGRETLGLSDIEEKAEEDSSVLPEEETKVETEPEDVDVEELRREVEEEKDSDTNDTDHDDN